jgi:hypothetical protein
MFKKLCIFNIPPQNLIHSVFTFSLVKNLLVWVQLLFQFFHSNFTQILEINLILNDEHKSFYKLDHEKNFSYNNLLTINCSLQ